MPVLNYSAEVEAIEERVNRIKPKLLKATNFDLTILDEFVKLLIPDGLAHTVHPYGFDEVYDRQSRPMQRAILDRAGIGEDPRLVQSFIKKEAYGEVKPPRVISTIQAKDKMRYSRFIYALSEEVIKLQPWYAFGVSAYKLPRVWHTSCMMPSRAPRQTFPGLTAAARTSCGMLNWL